MKSRMREFKRPQTQLQSKKAGCEDLGRGICALQIAEDTVEETQAMEIATGSLEEVTERYE